MIGLKKKKRLTLKKKETHVIIVGLVFGLENWVLVNQTNLRMDSDVERMKKIGFVLEQIVLGKIRGGLCFYIVLKFS